MAEVAEALTPARALVAGGLGADASLVSVAATARRASSAGAAAALAVVILVASRVAAAHDLGIVTREMGNGTWKGGDGRESDESRVDGWKSSGNVEFEERLHVMGISRLPG